THQVGHGGADRRGFEAFGLRDHPRSHKPAVAPTHHAQPVRIGHAHRDDVINSRPPALHRRYICAMEHREREDGHHRAFFGDAHVTPECEFHSLIRFFSFVFVPELKREAPIEYKVAGEIFWCLVSTLPRLKPTIQITTSK